MKRGDEVDLDAVRIIVAGVEAWERMRDADATIRIRSQALAKLKAALKEFVEADDLYHRQIWLHAGDDPDSAEILAFELEEARENAIEGEFGMDLDSMSGRGLWIMSELADLIIDFDCCWSPESIAEHKKTLEVVKKDTTVQAVTKILKTRRQKQD